MNKILAAFLMISSLYAGEVKAQDFAGNSALFANLEIDPFPAAPEKSKQGYLETTRISVGTILKSHHFSRNDFNETHHGIYLNFEQWSVGTYLNSGSEQSVFVTYNPELYRNKLLKVNLVAGVADGYEGWNYAQGEYLPMLGVSANWMNLRTMLSFDVVAFGFELPLN